MYGDKHSSQSIGIHNDCDNFKLLNIGWTEDGGYGGVTIAIAIIKAKFMPCLAGAWKALTHQSTKLYPAFLTPDTLPKSSGPVTADSEGGAEGSGASLRLAIGN